MDKLAIGRRFKSYNAFDKAIQEYASTHHIVMTNGDSRLLENDPVLKYKYIKKTCKHYGKKKLNKNHQNIRTHQRSFKTGCPAYIKASVINGALQIVSKNEEHSHVLDSDIVRFYPERRRIEKAEQESLGVKQLVEMGIDSRKLQKYLQQATGKSVRMKDIYNISRKLNEEERNSVSKAVAELIELAFKDPDAVVVLGKKKHDDPTQPTILTDIRPIIARESSEEEEEVKEEFFLEFIFFQTGKMRHTFWDYPEVVLTDTLYVTESKMPLSVTTVMDGYGKGRVVAYCFLTAEQTDSFSSMLRCLKQANPEAAAEMRTLVIDKDPSEIPAIHAVLGEVLIQICESHTLKALHEATQSKVEREIQRNETWLLLQKIVAAEDEGSFQSLIRQLTSSTSEELRVYLEEHWLCNKEAWVRYQRLITPSYRNHSTNRVGSCHHILKTDAERNTTLVETIKAVLRASDSINEHVVYLPYESVLKPVYPGSCDEVITNEVLNTFTPFAASVLLGQIDLMGEVQPTEDDSCSCATFRGYNLPCRHILRRRQLAGESLLEDVPPRWRIDTPLPAITSVFHEISETHPEVLLVTDVPSAPLPLSTETKFNEAMKICQDLAELISDCDGPHYESRMKVLDDILRNWEMGREVTVVEVKPGNLFSVGDETNHDFDCSDTSDGIDVSRHVIVTGSVPDAVTDTTPIVKGALQKLKGLSLPPLARTKGRPRGGSLNATGTSKRQKVQKRTPKTAPKKTVEELGSQPQSHRANKDVVNVEISNEAMVAEGALPGLDGNTPHIAGDIAGIPAISTRDGHRSLGKLPDKNLLLAQMKANF